MEQKAAHTAGPWNCNRSSASGYDIVCSENSPVDVCVISRRDKTTGEIDANARLIAAAPELLEACQTFAEWLRREEAGFPEEVRYSTPEGEAKWSEWFYENIRICDLAQEQARAAIAKATQ